MATYVTLSRFSPEAFADPKDFSFATLGRFDAVDIVEADDAKQVEKATMIIRAYGHSTTET